MQVGIVMYGGDFPTLVETVQIADAGVIDAVGFWDHFHSICPQDGPMFTGWGLYGHLAALTRRVRLCPLVLDGFNFSLGVLAKESSMLAIASGGRFEFGIGCGDFPREEQAWGLPQYAGPATRIVTLEETVHALRQLWTGEQVTFEGEHIRLQAAGCRASPPSSPRVIVGAGNSRRLVRSAVQYADEINIYGAPEHLTFTRNEIAACGRKVALSACADSQADWGEDVEKARDGLKLWEQRKVDRLFVTVWAPFTFLGYGNDSRQNGPYRRRSINLSVSQRRH